jgi:hypothetical protein
MPAAKLNKAKDQSYLILPYYLNRGGISLPVVRIWLLVVGCWLLVKKM